MHFYILDSEGTTIDVADFAVRLRLPDKDIGPIEVPISRLSTGHWSADSYSFPLPGTWTIDMSGRTSDLTSVNLSTELPIK